MVMPIFYGNFGSSNNHLSRALYASYLYNVLQVVLQAILTSLSDHIFGKGCDSDDLQFKGFFLSRMVGPVSGDS